MRQNSISGTITFNSDDEKIAKTICFYVICIDCEFNNSFRSCHTIIQKERNMCLQSQAVRSQTIQHQKVQNLEVGYYLELMLLDNLC
ncbi:hypothetical protein GWI33_018721 [Rhynchophorus ferrugineus]|uniref:Uncharacterized protein n=1 Tax=Rhynchophorus ferrugineus TaxID=354439 RepID=A0A834HT64_RHYFE|nr:hypothetical protein GWI33_018721 [Rhynchophorus ferrugineus]